MSPDDICVNPESGHNRDEHCRTEPTICCVRGCDCENFLPKNQKPESEVNQPCATQTVISSDVSQGNAAPENVQPDSGGGKAKEHMDTTPTGWTFRDNIATLERELEQTKARLAEVEHERDEARVNYANQVTDKVEAAPIDHAIFEGLRADLSAANLFIEILRHDLAHKELAYETDIGELSEKLAAAQCSKELSDRACFQSQEAAKDFLAQLDSAQHLAAEWQAVAEALRKTLTIIASVDSVSLGAGLWARNKAAAALSLTPADALREHDLKLAEEAYIEGWARKGETYIAGWKMSSTHVRLTKGAT